MVTFVVSSKGNVERSQIFLITLTYFTQYLSKSIDIIKIDLWNRSLQDYLIKCRLCICRKLQSFLRGTSPIRSPEPPSPHGREDRNGKIEQHIYFYKKIIED
jgi:hypothetical protein